MSLQKTRCISHLRTVSIFGNLGLLEWGHALKVMASLKGEKTLKLLRVSLLAGGFCVLLNPVQAAESPETWYQAGQNWIEGRQGTADTKPQARNVILFVGDGMSLTTVAAARILQGQQRGQSGEENYLFFERFENLALAKTYNTNQQTPDSAGTMTAMVTGVKSFAGAIAVDQNALRGNCASMEGTTRVSLLDLAALSGMATGVVSTTRITHATPAALFSKSPERSWESDRGLPPTAVEAGCRDIAQQLVEYDVGRGIDVVLGGGRRAFYPSEWSDPEYPDIKGHRTDGRNLVTQWQERHPTGHYVWNHEGFKAAMSSDSGGPVLGLFQPSHMQYEFDRSEDPGGEPSLTEMVTETIGLLQKRSDQGFVLVVESGRIDHAHHANNAWRALTDTIEFDRAIEAAVGLVDMDETLVIVTADHAHALTFDGYGVRGNPIMGYAVRPGDGPESERTMRDHEDQPMTMLNYANGPGYRRDDATIDFRTMDPLTPDYKQKAGTWQYSATHAGEDVPVYSIGPGADVLYGVVEQNVIYHSIINALPLLKQVEESLLDASGLPQWERVRATDQL